MNVLFRSYGALPIVVCFFSVALVCCAQPQASARGLILADGGRTDYVIVRSPEATPAERYAAEELATYLKRMTGADFPIVGERAGRAPCIVVGSNRLSGSALGSRKADRLGSEEFVVQSKGKDLFLFGGGPRGALYAVYHFLDNILGVRWWAPDAEYVPTRTRLELKRLNVRGEPRFEYRGVFVTTAWDPDWAARNRLNDRVLVKTGDTANIVPPDERHGGGMVYDEGFVHTFDKLIPASEYLESHPEWFSLIDGKRVGGQYTGQLCLTNPEVLDLVVERVKTLLRKQPGVSIVSVSQNDSAVGGCQCPKCKEIDEEEGSQSGSLIRFVNAVAERVEKDYPNALIDTLAYKHTQRPPKRTRARRNVIVRLCDIRCSFAQPLVDPSAGANKQFVDDLRAWSKVCDRLYVWDYIANFRNYLRPHPNLRVLGPNVRLFAANSVEGVFEQGSYWTPGGEFQELRSWVLSRLLWDPRQDAGALADEFLIGYYGEAAPFIREYIDLIHDRIPPTGYHLSISGDSEPSAVVNADTMLRAEMLFRKAEAAVKGRPDVLSRVRRAHLPVQCVWLQNHGEWSRQVEAKGLRFPWGERMQEAFRKQIASDGVTLFGEQRPIAQLLKSIKRGLSGGITTRASRSFGDSSAEDVFDGDPATGWNGGGFGPELIEKDLGCVTTVTSVRTLFGPPQLYSQVTYKIDGSVDGQSWHPLVPERTVNANEATDGITSDARARHVRTTVMRALGPGGQAPQWVGIYEQTISTK